MRRFRWLLVALLGLFVLSALTLFFVGRTEVRRTQTIEMPDGGRVEFIEATYGTNHMSGTRTAKFLARLPRPVQPLLRPLTTRFGTLQQTTTSEPSLVVWYEFLPNTNAPSKSSIYEARLMNGDGFVSGEDASVMTFFPGLYQLTFKVFPRREKMLRLLMKPPGDNSTETPTWTVTNLVNPFRANYSAWKPEPLPSTKTAGDLDVTLTKFSTGFGIGRETKWVKNKRITTFAPQEEHGRNESLFEVEFREAGKNNAPWTVAKEVLSDATGNAIANTSLGGFGADVYSLAPSLWPDEEAWKLKLIVKRTGGFASNEVFSFTGIPFGALGQTNQLTFSTNVQGVAIKLEHFVHRPPHTNEYGWSSSDLSELKLATTGIPEGSYLDLIEARCGTNKLEVPSFGYGGDSQEYSFRKIPEGATTFDATFVMHPSRTVEFLVKPVVRDPAMMRIENER